MLVLNQVLLGFCALAYVAIGVVFATTGVLDIFPEPHVANTAFSVGLLVLCVIFAGVNVAAIVGLGQRTKWGWVMGLVLCIFYVPSICAPIGLVLAWYLYQAREEYGF